jgi:hypothetical protein
MISHHPCYVPYGTSVAKELAASLIQKWEAIIEEHRKTHGGMYENF